ncbi:hypothetical protein SUGI_0458700 [Cryptomeria japonica]|nr:hypothetical protein SUGI_0458700 [Cryptomeria japonica]
MGRSNKANQLAQLVLLEKIMRRCHRVATAKKAALSLRNGGYFNLRSVNEEKGKGIPSDVPKGHVPVYVGNDRSRFIIPATHLNHPLFRQLLDKAEEDLGFDHDMGLFIPCEESAFECLVSLLDGRKSNRLIELRK